MFIQSMIFAMTFFLILAAAMNMRDNWNELTSWRVLIPIVLLIAAGALGNTAVTLAVSNATCP